MSDEQRKIEINWVQASAGALAAMSSAVLLSTVGVAGTIIGAALGSVLVTIGAEIYSATLHASRSRVGAVASTRMRVRRARAHVSQAATELGRARGRRVLHELPDDHGVRYRSGLRVRGRRGGRPGFVLHQGLRRRQRMPYGLLLRSRQRHSL